MGYIKRGLRSPDGIHKDRLLDSEGYVYLSIPEHPRSGKDGYVLEHIVIAERALGKSLPPKALVHHVNEDSSNNTNSNLVICQNQAYHMLLHARRRALLACGNANWRKCPVCKKYDDPRKLVAVGEGLGHLVCRNLAQKIRRWRKR